MVQFRKGRTSPWVVQIRGANGAVATRSFIRKEDAETFEAREKRKRQLMSAGLEAPKDNILLIDYSKVFLSRRFASPDLARSTVVQDESRLRNYWVPKFGTRPLPFLSSGEIKALLDEIQFEKKHSPADRNRHRALMHTLFEEAVRDEKVIYNPVSKIPLVPERRVKDALWTTEEEQGRYLEGLYARSEAVGLMGTILLWAGPRISEAIALRNMDIDYEHGCIRIRRVYERCSREIKERTKGQGVGGEYLTPLLPRVRDAIASFRKTSEYTRPSDILVAMPTGKPMGYETFRDAHEAVIAEKKLPHLTPHKLRKIFASNAQRAGFSKAEVQEMLGHSSVLTTERYVVTELEHLVEKARRLGFGSNSVSRMSARSLKNHRSGKR